MQTCYSEYIIWARECSYLMRGKLSKQIWALHMKPFSHEGTSMRSFLNTAHLQSSQGDRSFPAVHRYLYNSLNNEGFKYSSLCTVSPTQNYMDHWAMPFHTTNQAHRASREQAQQLLTWETCLHLTTSTLASTLWAACQHKVNGYLLYNTNVVVPDTEQMTGENELKSVVGSQKTKLQMQE